MTASATPAAVSPEPSLTPAIPLIPRDVLFGNPERVSPAISGDGSRLGFVAPLEGVLNVWVAPVDDLDAAVPVTHDTGHGVRVFGFAHDDRSLLYLRDTDGDENWRLYSLALDSAEEPRLLTPGEGVQTQILGHNRWYPSIVMVGLNARIPQLHDVYRVDLTTGSIDLVQVNPGFAGWLMDADHTVRGGIAVTEDGGVDVHLRNAAGDFELWRRIPVADADTTSVVGFTRDGSALLMLSAEESPAARLLRVDLTNGQEQVLVADEHYDVSNVLLHPETLEPQAAVVAKDRDEWVYLDDAMGAEIEQLRVQARGELSISRSERSDRHWLLTDAASDAPVRYYFHDRQTSTSRFLFEHKPALAQYRLAVMEPFVFIARDGLEIHGYLTVPPGAERHGLPAVLNVHGGPWVRDTWGYDAEAQWLANRGYVCAQVNYRGSTGYGKAFGNAGDKEWGRRMHDDLVDAVEHLSASGLVDATRVGIYGGSYGGYAALVGAAFTPDVFRCAVDIVGPSSLLTLLSSIPEYWKPMVALMHAKIGNPETEADMLWERSPLSRVDAITIPVLVAQGANDPRVKQAEAEQIVGALRDKNIPYEYLLFPDEGHGLVRPENRERFYAAAERFLGAHLGGLVEPAHEGRG